MPQRHPPQPAPHPRTLAPSLARTPRARTPSALALPHARHTLATASPADPASTKEPQPWSGHAPPPRRPRFPCRTPRLAPARPPSPLPRPRPAPARLTPRRPPRRSRPRSSLPLLQQRRRHSALDRLGPLDSRGDARLFEGQLHCRLDDCLTHRRPSVRRFPRRPSCRRPRPRRPSRSRGRPLLTLAQRAAPHQ